MSARALKDAGVKAEEIGKLVVVSSTGFLGPGLDCSLIKTLGLARSVTVRSSASWAARRP